MTRRKDALILRYRCYTNRQHGRYFQGNNVKFYRLQTRIGMTLTILD